MRTDNTIGINVVRNFWEVSEESQHSASSFVKNDGLNYLSQNPDVADLVPASYCHRVSSIRRFRNSMKIQEFRC